MLKIRINNVAGLNREGRLHAELNKSKRYDINLLQEVKIRQTKELAIKQKYGSHNNVLLASNREGNGSSRGVLTLFKPNANFQQLDDVRDRKGQYLLSVIRNGNQNMLIGNYYGDPDTDNAALATVERLAQDIQRTKRKFRIDEVLIGGDFNFVLNPEDTTMERTKPRTAARFTSLIEELDIFDVDPIIQAGRTVYHTYFRHNHEDRSARYDRIYISRGLLIEARIERLYRTGDHAPLLLEIGRREKTNKWRIDDASLKTVETNKMIQEEIARVLRPMAEDVDEDVSVERLQYEIDFERYCPVATLEKVMMAIRTKLKKASWEKREEMIKKETALVKEIIEARERVNVSNTEENRGILQEKRERLKIAQEKRARQAAERNYAQYSQCGERMTRYHFSIMNKGKAGREIGRMKIGNRVSKDTGEIANRMAEKFSEIARPRNPNDEVKSIEEFMGEDLIRGVNKCQDQESEVLNRPFTEEEVTRVVKKMKKISAPGPKGISNLLMKTLLPMLVRVITEAGNKMLDEEEFMAEAKWIYKRTVVFILKPGKNPEDEDSYRGLSMLENTFKIYSKILADRLARVLKNIQDPYQYGFTEGKSCPEPTRTIIDVMNWAKEKRKPLVVLSTDLYKAFDSIHHDHMENCLKFYNFPEDFSKRVMKMVRHGTMQFEVNGKLSEEYKLERGTGQGDPKSCYLYNLAVLPLNEYLSKDSEVPRFKVEGREINPVYFADDNLCLLRGDQIDGIRATLRKIMEYEKVSGLRLNLKKCEIMTMNCDGGEIGRLIQETGMKNVPRIKHLGVIIEDDGRVSQEQNITPIIEKMEAIADRYSSSGSTPIGRSLYATFLLCQRYVHRLQSMALTERSKEDMMDAIHMMVWTRARWNEQQVGYRVHIAKSRLKQPYKYGGLGVPDPDMQSMTIRMGWFRRFNESYRNEGWFIVLSRWLEEVDRPSVVQHMKMGEIEWRKTGERIRQKSEYWADVFTAGAEIQRLAVEEKGEWEKIPIMGISGRKNIITRSSIEYVNPEARQIVNSQLKVVGQLFHINQQGQINSERMKTRQEVQAEFNCIANPMMWNVLVSEVNKIKRKYSQRRPARAVRPGTETVLERIVRKHAKGNSAANRLFLSAERKEWSHRDVPRSYQTYKDEGITQIEAKEFMEAFEQVRKSELLASFQWTSTQILLRTLWTRVKESRARPYAALGDDRCVNCLMGPEHTAHLMFDCVLAQGVLRNISRMINLYTEIDVNLTRDVVLFHVKPGEITNELQRDLTDILMIVKHVLYRSRFDEEIVRLPTAKGMTIIVISELTKFERISEAPIQGYIDDLRRIINWN